MKSEQKEYKSKSMQMNTVKCDVLDLKSTVELEAAIIAYVNLLQDQSSHHYSMDGEWAHTSLSLVEELFAADASE